MHMPNLFDILNSQIFWKLKVKHTHESQPRSTTAATLLAHISRDSARTHQPRLCSHTSAATSSSLMTCQPHNLFLAYTTNHASRTGELHSSLWTTKNSEDGNCLDLSPRKYKIGVHKSTLGSNFYILQAAQLHMPRAIPQDRATCPG